MTTILTNNRTLLCVPVPLEAFDYGFWYDFLGYHIPGRNGRAEYVKLKEENGPAKFCIIGSLINSATPVLDFDPEEFVEDTFITDNFGTNKYFRNYVNHTGAGATSISAPLKDATQSFLSLLEANGMMMRNPITKPEYFTTPNSDLHSTTWEELMTEWQSFEDKLIRKLIIIEKI